MGIRGQEGFTIIETTLFLAVTGLLIFMMIAGTGASLNVQRYRDSVETFKSLLQQQYTELASVQNSRTNNWSCTGSSNVVQNGSNDKIRGQSDCFLVGKYIRIDNKDIAVYPVIATQTGTVTYDDVTSLRQNYALNASRAEVVESTLDWDTQIAWSGATGGVDFRSPNTPRTLGLLFIRSPDSGRIYTFTSDTIQPKPSIGQPTFTNLLVSGNSVPGQRARMICIESQGLVNGDRGVYLSAYAASTSAVETRSNEYSTSLGDATRC